jgi:hypothetical protein
MVQCLTRFSLLSIKTQTPRAARIPAGVPEALWAQDPARFQAMIHVLAR